MQQVVGLLFSKDRAMQVDATIRSLSVQCQDMQNMDVKVLWVASNSQSEQHYQELANTYSDIEFIRQVDFKSQVLTNISGYEYVLFLVDDTIFVREFSIQNIIESLRANPDVLGFSLRLGRNTSYCYPFRQDQQLPIFMQINHEFLKFDWTLAQHDFGYPLEVSSSVYRVKDIIAVLYQSFANPNMLEAYLAHSKMVFYYLRKCLLCNQYSYAFCNPVNKVQSTFDNRAGEEFYYSTDQLQEMFAQGYRINVEEYHGFIPNACHQEVELIFKKM